MFSIPRVLVASIVILGASVGGAVAQAFPNKPVRLIVGYAAGSGADIVGRLVADRLAERWGQPVIVEDRPGAAGNVAADLVAKSAPDGYTLLLATSSHAINPALYPHLNFDAEKDFSAISLVSSSPLILVVNASLGVNSVKEFIEAAKVSKTHLDYASAGNGNLTHLAAELFKSMAEIDMVHIPYNGGPPAIADLLAGRVAAYFSGLPAALPYVANSQLRALAVTTATRSPAAATVPTMAEAGLPGYEIDLWYGLLGPARLPDKVVAKINADVAAILIVPDMVQRFSTLGVSPNPSSSDKFKSLIAHDVAFWRHEVSRMGIKLE